ncbi:MAG: AbrB/MazE/SpoVT family DNA-binding domain-containing protein [Candidatus Kapabacteria bacterium]|nr:AbrB/MazE/SpoVT family DNA-binding domain-containing protein [Candidatus Kapabacteria bacterium]
MFTKVSQNYRVQIPRDIRNSLKINAGQEVQIIQFLDRIETIQLKPTNEMIGFLKGMDTEIVRDEYRL